MSHSKTKTIRLGLFVTIALLFFAIAIYNIGSKQQLFGSTFQVHCVFSNVNGLQSGNNVRYSGINVGVVDEIMVVDDSTLLVNMDLEEEAKAYLKKDAIASLGTDGLVGNMIVNISPGKGDKRPIEEGDKIDSYARAETSEVLNTLGNTTENIALLTVNLLEVVENINSGKGSISQLLNDPRMANDLQLALRNLRLSTQHINTLGATFNESVHKIQAGEGLLGYLLTDTLMEQQMQQISLHMDSLVDTKINPIIHNLTQSSEYIVATTSQLDSLMGEIQLHEGLAGTLLKDTLIGNDLKATMQHLKLGTEKFDENMKALQHNFLFRRYFKKQEKKRRKELKKAEAAIVKN